jgi:excisionase family DNA binding protein
MNPPSQPEAATPLLSLSDVAELLQVSKAWVRDHTTRRSPRIPVVRFGGKRAVLRFRRQDVDQFITDNLTSTAEERL